MRFMHGLNLETQHLLRRCYKESKHRRVRQRAHCILLSFYGKPNDELVHIFHVTRLTIYYWFNVWEACHFAGLYDNAGHGRHSKLTREEQEKVQQYIEEYPQDMKKVVYRLKQEMSKCVSTRTIKRLLKKPLCYVWKRIKHAPEKSLDPEKYERSKALIQRLHTREIQGECDVWYFDGSGFCLTPSIPYAWQPIGSVIEVPTSTHNRLINVLGFLTRHNVLVPYVIEGRVDTAVVIECFEQLSQQLNKLAYVVLDNTSIQKSQEFIQHIPHWVKCGLIIKYLPPYIPELNLIEILWSFIKYY